jgi:hypothetical protein
MEGVTMIRGLILGFVLLLFSCTAAYAQQTPCFPTVDFEKLAKKQYGEQKAWMGFSSSGEAQDRVLILYENEETRSWTVGILITKKDMICFIASGDDFIHLEPKSVIKKGKKL